MIEQVLVGIQSLVRKRWMGRAGPGGIKPRLAASVAMVVHRWDLGQAIFNAEGAVGRLSTEMCSLSARSA